MEFKEKFIAFVDILGFKQMVEAVEAGQEIPLGKFLSTLASPVERDVDGSFIQWVCPVSEGIQKDLDFQVKQISDCVVVSSEISPPGLINLVHHCWSAVSGLLHEGVMCRGYITRGRIYHTPEQFVGSGYQKAYAHESNVAAFKRHANERGTPFVEVDPIVCSYVNNCNDSCVKRMFPRYVKTEGTATALFPFQRLQHQFVIGSGREFNPESEKRSNRNVRRLIEGLKERMMLYVDQSNPDAVSKLEHYVGALDHQLALSVRTDLMIDWIGGQSPAKS